jgi:hypothetical protein
VKATRRVILNDTEHAFEEVLEFVSCVELGRILAHVVVVQRLDSDPLIPSICVSAAHV